MSGVKHIEAPELPVGLLALPPFPSVALKARPQKLPAMILHLHVVNPK